MLLGGGILAPSTGRGIEKFPSLRNSPCFGRGPANRKEPNYWLFADNPGADRFGEGYGVSGKYDFCELTAASSELHSSPFQVRQPKHPLGLVLSRRPILAASYAVLSTIMVQKRFVSLSFE